MRTIRGNVKRFRGLLTRTAKAVLLITVIAIAISMMLTQYSDIGFCICCIALVQLIDLIDRRTDD